MSDINEAQPIGPPYEYQEAGVMFRHYSSSRTTAIAVLLPICFALGGWALNNLNNPPVLFYLVFTEVLLYFWLCASSIYFSSRLKKIRLLLRMLEKQGKLTDKRKKRYFLFKFLDTHSTLKSVKLDYFDKWLISVGVLTHLLLTFYLITG